MRDEQGNQSRYKSMHTDDGEVLYAEYLYRGITYRQAEITLEQEMQIGEILTELDIDNLRSFSDLVNVKIGMFISSALKNRLAPRLLAIVLVRADGNPIEESELRRGLARDFNPFFKLVAQDFFSLNSDVLQPITDFVEKHIAGPLKLFGELTGLFKQSMLSLKATSPSSAGSSPRGAAMR
jgi:hypothetical protein